MNAARNHRLALSHLSYWKTKSKNAKRDEFARNHRLTNSGA
jgi:hypothetical protein